jgi:hypothetical protein
VQGALRLVKPAQASLPYCSHWPVEPDVVTLSSSDTEEALELLPLSPGCGVSSRLLGALPRSLGQALVVICLKIRTKPMI